VYIKDESFGIRIMHTEAYKAFIRKNVVPMHQNLGDFYSEVPVEGLAEAICKILGTNAGGHKLDQEVIVVDRSKFSSGEIEFGKDYLIREADGLRYYVPDFHSPWENNAKQSYILSVSIFIPALFSNPNRGSPWDNLKKAQDPGRLKTKADSIAEEGN